MDRFANALHYGVDVVMETKEHIWKTLLLWAPYDATVLFKLSQHCYATLLDVAGLANHYCLTGRQILYNKH